MDRKLPKAKNSSNSSIVVPKTPSPRAIRVISTFGSDSDLLNVVRKFQPELTSSPSFASNPDLTTTPKNNRLFQLVKRTGSSLKSKLVKTKQMALNKTTGKRTACCNKKNCQGCRIIADGDSFNINGVLARPAGGSCITYNIIYCFICSICTKGYIGRSVQQLNERAGQHRRNFYEMLRDITS